jgi:hypothetical protein
MQLVSQSTSDPAFTGLNPVTGGIVDKNTCHWQTVVAHLVVQSTSDAAFKGLNSAAAGTRRKLQKYMYLLASGNSTLGRIII